ncbi:MAG: aspartyl protease family protein [Pseudomonadota bacterium]|nr:aspartyl protease family protein [Pseudomonadota bacterium]
MPDIVGSHNGSQVFVSVILLPVERFEDTLDPQRLSKVPNLQVLRALLDTGAQVTSITEKAANRLNLEPSGIVGIQGFGGPTYCSSYIFKLGFVDLQQANSDISSPTSI